MKRDRMSNRSNRLISPPIGTSNSVEDGRNPWGRLEPEEASRNGHDFARMEEERAGTIERLSAYLVPEPSHEETSRLAAALVARWEAGLDRAEERGEEESRENAGRERTEGNSRYRSCEEEHVRLSSHRAHRSLGTVRDAEASAERYAADRWRLFGGSSAMRAIAAIGPQVRIFSWRFWLASALIVLFAGLCGGPLGTADAHPLMFALPLLAAAGVATAFRSYGTPMFELEMSCPLSPPQLVFGRLFIVLAYDAALGLAASGLTDRHGAGVALFVLAWLVPLALISLLTLTVMLYAGVVAGLLTTLVVWSLQLILRERLEALYLFASPTTTAFVHSCVLGLLLVVLLFGLARHKTRALAWGGGAQDL